MTDTWKNFQECSETFSATCEKETDVFSARGVATEALMRMRSGFCRSAQLGNKQTALEHEYLEITDSFQHRIV